MNKIMNFILYGGNPYYLNEEEKRKAAEVSVKFLLFYCLFLLISIAILIFIFLNFLNKTDCNFQTYKTLNYSKADVSFENISIKYRGLSDDEISHFESIFYNLNPIYLTKNKNFIVYAGKIPGYDDNTYGANFNEGEKIALRYVNSDKMMQVDLCHELLHSYMIDASGGETPEHQIVYDLGELQVCFENENTI